MRLLDNLRQAEQKGVQAVRKSVERAREEWFAFAQCHRSHTGWP